MNITEFQEVLKDNPILTQVKWWAEGRQKSLFMKGFLGSAPAMFLHNVGYGQKKSAVFVLRDEEEAGYFFNDLQQYDTAGRVFFFPSSYKKSIRSGAVKDSANQVLRTETLNECNSSEWWTVVTYPQALAEKVVSKKRLSGETLHLSVGEKVGLQFVIDTLTAYGFEQTEFVYEPGQFSVRGSLIDVFSFSNDLPYRIDFWGDDIDSIRSFDIENQLSVDSFNSISIISNTVNEAEDELVPVTEFFNSDTIFCIFDIRFMLDTISGILTDNPDSDAFADTEAFEDAIREHRCIEIGGKNYLKTKNTLEAHHSPHPIFHKDFDVAANDFRTRKIDGYQVFVFSDNAKQIERLKDIFEDKQYNITFTPVIANIHEGFIDNDSKVCVYTDHQIFDRFHKYSLKSTKTRAGKVVMSIKELMQLKVGDYIVHIDHGVGQFGGLVHQESGGNVQEMVKLIYKDNDIVFVNIHSLHRISKYKGRDGEAPKLNKIGGNSWANLKERTKKRVKDIARELIQLYAARKQEEGFKYSPDSYLQQELESSFIYEDTPDQRKATDAVKADMEKSKPMDRLICGDVGFGKTEIAIRAAFKAVTDNKQVAVLVPTTVLAFQHYKSFSRRLKRFPCTIDYLSRARKPSDIKEIKQKLTEGKIDILIGTHKLLGNDVKFKDLGLLIIDEEQKFGVSSKEKLRQIKVNVDTLTLTATPIPRTLQFSLMGARDMSVITTPPPNRYPVQTELIGLDADTIKEAIEFEIARGGQVFFVNNRISNLPELEAFLHKLVPKAKICVGHGQMESEKLEDTLLNFINGEYDILLSTSIIESGVDIPNVNTMFINDAQHFGLSDLHQLRGRVGRTNKKAFCYLITPPLSSIPPDARRRVQAIENFADLGSGIHIAMQDLDIRGAGNILGGEQSGFIADLGYETYHRILDEAMSELRHDEFKEVFADEIAAEDTVYATDCIFDSDLELLLPSDYIESVSERVELYRRLDGIKTEDNLIQFEKELEDRFGPIPDVAKALISVVRFRQMCMRSGIEKVVLKRGMITAYFISNFNSIYYQSENFNKVLLYAMNHPTTTEFKEEGEKRFIKIKGIDSISKAIDCLKEM
ncbi:MAG: transcription-repair coupling factor [Paludibacteraceae bacterium]|nr:transcription-repair coupling factor [Paludibacteraceae bacterium]